MIQKAAARFNQFFLEKFGLDPSVDNTPPLLKTASPAKKVEYLHMKVKEALKDLLPMFRDCEGVLPDLIDYPVKQPSSSEENEQPHSMNSQSMSSSLPEDSSSEVKTPTKDCLDQYMYVSEKPLSSTRYYKSFGCSLCDFESGSKTVVVAHIRECWKRKNMCPDVPDDMDNMNVNSENCETDDQDDYFWTYKNAEFFIDSVFKLILVYEKQGNGAGMFALSKLMLPILNSLGHSNYANSIHRFIGRVLTSTTPREALLLVWERFCNRSGKIGGNICKDRRIEFRINQLKKLINNQGSNVTSASIQRTNDTVDIKEKLFHHARKAQGVIIRSGKHKMRSDQKDYKVIFDKLSELRAHEIIAGRKFGNLTYPENLLTYEKFNRANFFRWITTKNKDLMNTLQRSHALSALPNPYN